MNSYGRLSGLPIFSISKKLRLPYMIIKNGYTILLLTFTLMSLSFGPCEESLPVYQEPTRVFSGKIEGAYTLSAQDNSMKVFFIIWNNFDETLQGNAVLKGNIEIVSLRAQSIRKTFTVSAANIIQSKGYDKTTGKLTIDPRDSIRFMVSWDLKDDTGRDLRRTFFSYIADTTCPGRCLAFTEDFSLRGNITLFEKTGAVFAGPSLYSLCFVNVWVRAGACPPIITSLPCNLRPPQSVSECVPTFFFPIP